MSDKPSKHSRSTPSVSTNTRYVDRMLDALALLCGGNRPARELVVGWEDNSSEELQSWAVCHAAVPWATGIGTIEAAQAMADTPEEGMGHQDRLEAFPSTRVSYVPTPAGDLAERIESAIGSRDWNLTMAGAGQGSLSDESGIQYFDSPQNLDNILTRIIADAATAEAAAT